MRYLLLLALLLPFNCKADDDVGYAVRAATGYVGTLAFFGLYKAVLTANCRYLEKGPCKLTTEERLGVSSLAAFTAFTLGAAYDGMEFNSSSGNFLSNGLGSGAALGTILVFDF